MDSEQGATSLLESVKAHVNERLKSPFGGAFVVAWIIVNWEKLFVLILSKESAENRAKIFSEQMNNADGLWLPLGYAVLGLISYYAFSGLAIALFEIYGVLRRYVEQKFDDYRWVSPDQYIEWKKGSVKAIKDIQEIASDKLDKIVNLEGAVTGLELGKAKLEEKIQELEYSEEKLKLDLLKSKNEIARTKKAFEDVRQTARDEAREEIGQLADKFLALSMDLQMRLVRLNFLAADEARNGSAEIIDSVIKAGNELTHAIEAQWRDEPF
jgi:hypothetical protein